MVFDVETTGLLYKPILTAKNIAHPESIEEIDARRQNYLNSSPYITQFCCIVYDVALKNMHMFSSYVKIPDDVAITEEITKLTGFDREKSNSGMSIINILSVFYENYKKSDIIVAHNIAFDKEMINIELSRNSHNFGSNPDIVNFRLNDNTVFNDKKMLYCTMHRGRNVCNIKLKYISSDGTEKSRIKNPKLSELHEKLFGYVPENLHDAITDTLACLRCFASIEYNITLESV